MKPYEDLANLSLARTFYSTGQYDLAAKYFDRVSHRVVRLAQQPVRGLVGELHAAGRPGYSKALGNIHTLQAPYFENFIKPESVAEALTVKATIYFYNCLYDRAADAIDEFRESFEPLALDSRSWSTRTTANDQFFELADKIREGRLRACPSTPSAPPGPCSPTGCWPAASSTSKELDRELGRARARPTRPGSRRRWPTPSSPTSPCSAR